MSEFVVLARELLLYVAVQHQHEALLETFFITRSLFAIRLMALKTYAERPEIRDYAHRVVPLMLGEIRRFVARRDGETGAAPAPGLSTCVPTRSSTTGPPA